jgi:hypothetical protein
LHRGQWQMHRGKGEGAGAAFVHTPINHQSPKGRPYIDTSREVHASACVDGGGSFGCSTNDVGHREHPAVREGRGKEGGGVCGD